MRVIREEGKIKVFSEYSSSWVKKARQLNGKWNDSRRSWEFDMEKEKFVLVALEETYGYTENDLAETVTIRIRAAEYENYNKIVFGSIVVAHRRYRDSDVQLKENAFVIKGDFSSSGGSVKNPRINADDDVVIEVKNVPKALLDKMDGEYEVVAKDIDMNELLAEKGRLLKRLEEIEQLISQI